MKLVLGYGSGSGYMPYTQKPVDYQPYRPVYLFRGPPPDAGFSYGLFEDKEVQKKYYAEMGLEPYSPFTGKPATFLEEIDHSKIKHHLGDELNSLEKIECRSCGSEYYQNLRKGNLDRELFCHKCGAKINMALIEHPKVDEPKPGEAKADFSNDPKIQNFIKKNLSTLLANPELKELVERIALEKNIKIDQAKKYVLKELRDSI